MNLFLCSSIVSFQYLKAVNTFFNIVITFSADTSKERASSETKRPIGGVSMFGAGGGALQDALRKRRATSSSSSVCISLALWI